VRLLAEDDVEKPVVKINESVVIISETETQLEKGSNVNMITSEDFD